MNMFVFWFIFSKVLKIERIVISVLQVYECANVAKYVFAGGREIWNKKT